MAFVPRGTMIHIDVVAKASRMLSVCLPYVQSKCRLCKRLESNLGVLLTEQGVAA